jgi:hypothetical protein
MKNDRNDKGRFVCIAKRPLSFFAGLLEALGCGIETLLTVSFEDGTAFIAYTVTAFGAGMRNRFVTGTSAHRTGNLRHKDSTFLLVFLLYFSIFHSIYTFWKKRE